MAKGPETLDEMFEAEAAERLAKAISDDTPESRAKLAAKLAAYNPMIEDDPHDDADDDADDED